MNKESINIYIILNASYCKKVTEELIKSGRNCGIIFINGYADKLLSDENAAKIGMKPEFDAEEMEFLTAIIKKTSINIFFHKTKDSLLKIAFYPLYGLWEKEFPGTGRIAIDSQRYIQLFLNMVCDYEIIKLEVEKEEDH